MPRIQHVSNLFKTKQNLKPATPPLFPAPYNLPNPFLEYEILPVITVRMIVFRKRLLLHMLIMFLVKPFCLLHNIHYIVNTSSLSVH